MTNKQIEKAYKKMLEAYIGIRPNGVNCYKCLSCGHVTKTEDIAPGVTPFMHSCEQCSNAANSTMYRDIAPEKSPTQEWYRPTLKQIKKSKSPHLLDHVLNGGLLSRPIVLAKSVTTGKEGTNA